MTEKKIVSMNGINIAVIKSDELVITDTQSAVDLSVTAQYDDNCRGIAIFQEAIAEDFFKLSTGLAGEVLQKFVNFSVKLAIIGDFSVYTSKALNDFIFECNNGNQIFFVADEETALGRIAESV